MQKCVNLVDLVKSFHSDSYSNEYLLFTNYLLAKLGVDTAENAPNKVCAQPRPRQRAAGCAAGGGLLRFRGPQRSRGLGGRRSVSAISGESGICIRIPALP